MSGSPVALTRLPDDEKTARAMQDLVTQLSRDGVFTYSYSVPLYDARFAGRIAVISNEETAAGPTPVASLSPNWTTLLTTTLTLDSSVKYLLTAWGSCDGYILGAGQDAMDVRVHDGTSALQSLRGSSRGPEWYVSWCVPAYKELSAGTTTLSLTLDAQLLPVTGNPFTVERMRLFAVATPVDLVRPQ